MVPKTPTSPKAFGAALGGLLAGVVLAILLAIQSDPSQIEGLPSWAQFVIVAVLPSVISFLGAYAKRDPLRDAGYLAGGNDAGSASVTVLLFAAAVVTGLLMPALILPGLVLCAIGYAAAALNQHRQIEEVCGER